MATRPQPGDAFSPDSEQEVFAKFHSGCTVSALSINDKPVGSGRAHDQTRRVSATNRTDRLYLVLLGGHFAALLVALALILAEHLLAQTVALWRDLDEFIIADVLDRIIEAQRARRLEPYTFF